MNRTYVKAFVSAVVAAVLMGWLGVFVKESGCSAQGCAFARFAIGLVLLTAVCWPVLRRAWRFSWASVFSGVGISLCILLYFLAIRCMSMGVAALLLYTGPVFASVGEAALARRWPLRRDVLLLTLSVAGILLVSCCAPGGVSGSGSVWGVGLGVLSGVCYAVYILFNRMIPEGVGVSMRAFWQFAAGALVLFLPLLFVERPFEGISAGWPYILCIGVLQGFAVLFLVAYAVKFLSAIQFGAISYLEPALAVVVGWAVYREALAPWQWLGVALIFSSSFAQSLFPRKA